MKIEYGNETLGDDTEGDRITDNGGTHTRSIHREPLMRAAQQFVVGRVNHANERSFTIFKTHADWAASVGYWNRHPDELEESGELRITQDGEANTMDAVLQSVDRVELLGVSTTLRYNFTGGRIIEAV